MTEELLVFPMRQKATVGRFRVDLSIEINGQMRCDWSPETPDKMGRLTEKEIAAYRRVRDRLVERFVKATGHKLIVVET